MPVVPQEALARRRARVLEARVKDGAQLGRGLGEIGLDDDVARLGQLLEGAVVGVGVGVGVVGVGVGFVVVSACLLLARAAAGQRSASASAQDLCCCFC